VKELPNGVTIFNATPHVLRFWDPSWAEPVEVEPDEVINARVDERVVDIRECVTIVRTEFISDDQGVTIAIGALERGADVVVGSMIAARAYPGLVMGMVPAEGFERVPPAEKRMRPDKFTLA
jgi:hypothetical protein